MDRNRATKSQPSKSRQSRSVQSDTSNEAATEIAGVLKKETEAGIVIQLAQDDPEAYSLEIDQKHVLGIREIGKGMHCVSVRNYSPHPDKSDVRVTVRRSVRIQDLFPSSTQAWRWDRVRPQFQSYGCSNTSCPFHRPPDCSGGSIFCCALNVSNALLAAGYTLPSAANVNYCAHGRVRNADGMARICMTQNNGHIDASGWANRPNWKGIVYFEGGEVTQHIDLWDGTNAVHTSYPGAATVWFWKLG